MTPEDEAYWNEVRDPPMHYDRLGVGISLREWVDLRERDDYFRIAETIIADRFRVSTVWLGIDHNFWVGPPLIFETMVFDLGEPYHDLEMERYSTEVDARLGHQRMVQLVTELEAAGGDNSNTR